MTNKRIARRDLHVSFHGHILSITAQKQHRGLIDRVVGILGGIARKFKKAIAV
jgi:hypothetical protein